MSNETPTVWSEGITVERLNSLLDQVTSKPISNASLAAQIIRAALQLHGFTLPVLEVEGGQGGYYGRTSADGPAILAGISAMTDPAMYAPPAEGEWIFKITDADGPDNDFDDDLYLYIVMDMVDMGKKLGLAVDAYAQVLSGEDLDILSDDDYQEAVGGGNEAEHEGDRAGESDYQKKIRHTDQPS